MLRKSASGLLLLTGLLIGLGAFGHSFMGRKALDAGLAALPLNAHTDKLIYLVWYFCGGCMLIFGALVVWAAWNAMRADRSALVASALVGVFYLLAGVASLAYMREPFWSVFVVLGALALVLSGLLALPSHTRASAPRGQPAA